MHIVEVRDLRPGDILGTDGSRVTETTYRSASNTYEVVVDFNGEEKRGEFNANAALPVWKRGG